MKKLTVLMPVYNGSLDWVEGAVSSILNQSFYNFHFLIINDGSNHEMTEFLMSLPSMDGRIKILNNDGNKGLVYSLNRGLEACNTEWMLTIGRFLIGYAFKWLFWNNLRKFQF